MEEKQTGDCKHGVFMLRDGCPQCMAEARGETAGSVPAAGLATAAQAAGAEVTGVSVQVVEPVTAIINIAPGQDEKVVALMAEVMRAEEWADKFEIVSQEDDEAATNDLVLLKNVSEAIEEKRKEYVVPLNGYIKAVNDAFKLLSEPLDAAIKSTRAKATAYRLELQRRQREQEEINRKRMEAAEAEMKLKGELTESVDLVEVEEAPKLTRAALGTSGLMDVWKYEVVDFALLPDEYKVVDTAPLNAIAKKHHDQKQVPGVRFYNDPTLQTRGR